MSNSILSPSTLALVAALAAAWGVEEKELQAIAAAGFADGLRKALEDLRVPEGNLGGC